MCTGHLNATGRLWFLTQRQLRRMLIGELSATRGTRAECRSATRFRIDHPKDANLTSPLTPRQWKMSVGAGPRVVRHPALVQGSDRLDVGQHGCELNRRTLPLRFSVAFPSGHNVNHRCAIMSARPMREQDPLVELKLLEDSAK